MPQGRAAAVAEEAAPEPSQSHGNNGYGTAFEDNLYSAAEGPDFSIGGQSSFGDDAHHVAGIQFFVNAFESCVIDLWHPVAGPYGNGFGEPENGTEYRRLEYVVVHNEPHRSPHGTRNDQRIHIGNMVADQQYRAFLRDAVQAFVAYPIDGVGKHPHDKPEGKFRYLLVHEARHHQVHDSQHQEELGNTDADNSQHKDAHKCADHHEQGVEYVQGGNNTGSPVLRRFPLHKRVKRDDKQPAKEAYAQQVDGYLPVLAVAENHPPVGGYRVGRHVEVEVKAEEADAQGADGHDAQFDPVAGKPFTGHGAQCDTNGENRQQ